MKNTRKKILCGLRCRSAIVQVRFGSSMCRRPERGEWLTTA